MPSDKQRAQLILERGPLTKAELRQLSSSGRKDFLRVMWAEAEKLGDAEFAKQSKGDLRRRAMAEWLTSPKEDPEDRSLAMIGRPLAPSK